MTPNAYQIYTYARKFRDAYGKAMEPLCRELELPQAAVEILLFLANNPGLNTAKDICTYLRLKPGLVSLHVERLVQEGYLERCTAPKDRRRCPLVCTRMAEAAISRGRSLQADFSASLVRGLDAGELERFLGCLSVMEENLNALAAGSCREKEGVSNESR